ncbi:SixA phosphatase family protein [Sandaracinobacteroides saxicola]|uniref:Histidine phosphatase family protein n=1 Tax=Sandaracinobacteroides saxicola TaxID=2759707 RepID=A0A7G5IMT9_9SPHN|nr:histidine phosphatase family protein [Sandaracinobacteroides saxicola]QMW24681.1 histidine phosphatase family protein [Sandaracinobacteroides saxicola]
MRTLSLLRHAKSSWDDPVETDFDRPLNGRGRRAAVRMGRYLRDEGLAFDRIIASPALRIRQTIEGLEEGLGGRLQVTFDRRIYMASAVTLFDLVQAESDATGRLLLVGHNPGLEDLALIATPEDDAPLRAEAYKKYPTATLAEIVFEGARWAEAAEGKGRLTRFVRPRDLDPSLGPDD